MQDDEPVYSRAEIGGMVQQAFEICATCACVRSDHPGDEACTSCNACPEFWEFRKEHEDGFQVIDHEVRISGGASVALNSRVPTEFWDSLKADQEVRITLDVRVNGKSTRIVRHEGEVVGVVESRKLSVEGLVIE